MTTAKEQASFYERYGFETVAETPHAVTMVARL